MATERRKEDKKDPLALVPRNKSRREGGKKGEKRKSQGSWSSFLPVSLESLACLLGCEMMWREIIGGAEEERRNAFEDSNGTRADGWGRVSGARQHKDSWAGLTGWLHGGALKGRVSMRFVLQC